MQAPVLHSQVEVVYLHGHLNAARAEDLQHHLTRAVESSHSVQILIDMTQVESMDSAGLMALVATQRLAHRLGRELHLCGISPSVRIIFELTQLDRVFQIVLDRAALLTRSMPVAA